MVASAKQGVADMERLIAAEPDAKEKKQLRGLLKLRREVLSWAQGQSSSHE